MKFHLYELTVQRAGEELHGYIVAPTRDRAWMVYIEHEEALGLSHDDLVLKRIDEDLPEDRRAGIDDLLEGAPVGFASFAGRWIPHIAPVAELKLYRLVDHDGGDIFAIAPNIDIAALVFTSALAVRRAEVRKLRIEDGMVDLSEGMICNLRRLLEFGPIGVVRFDAHTDEWLVS